MSAFNVVVVPVDEACPNCGSKIVRRVQFKYGDRRAYEYAVGDALRWGGSDRGVAARLVRVMGFPEPCPICDFDPDTLYDVTIRDNLIESVTPTSGEPYPADGYVVVDA